jgi:hypothetical protein
MVHSSLEDCSNNAKMDYLSNDTLKNYKTVGSTPVFCRKSAQWISQETDLSEVADSTRRALFSSQRRTPNSAFTPLVTKPSDSLRKLNLERMLAFKDAKDMDVPPLISSLFYEAHGESVSSIGADCHSFDTMVCLEQSISSSLNALLYSVCGRGTEIDADELSCPSSTTTMTMLSYFVIHIGTLTLLVYYVWFPLIEIVERA